MAKWLVWENRDKWITAQCRQKALESRSESFLLGRLWLQYTIALFSPLRWNFEPWLKKKLINVTIQEYAQILLSYWSLWDCCDHFHDNGGLSHRPKFLKLWLWTTQERHTSALFSPLLRDGGMGMFWAGWHGNWSGHSLCHMLNVGTPVPGLPLSVTLLEPDTKSCWFHEGIQTEQLQHFPKAKS